MVGCPFHFAALGTLSYCTPYGAPIASVYGLSPDHFRRNFARWVSYYALFKWWLPLSQHPHCLSKITSFFTEPYFGTLTDGLDYSPLDNGRYHPLSDCLASLCGIRSLIKFSTPVGALAYLVLYLHQSAPDAIPKYISERTSYHRV
jgi:hypothetical protein